MQYTLFITAYTRNCQEERRRNKSSASCAEILFPSTSLPLLSSLPRTAELLNFVCQRIPHFSRQSPRDHDLSDAYPRFHVADHVTPPFITRGIDCAGHNPAQLPKCRYRHNGTKQCPNGSVCEFDVELQTQCHHQDGGSSDEVKHRRGNHRKGCFKVVGP